MFEIHNNHNAAACWNAVICCPILFFIFHFLDDDVRAAVGTWVILSHCTVHTLPLSATAGNTAYMHNDACTAKAEVKEIEMGC